VAQVDAKQILAVAKKNAVSIIAGVVALLAIAFLLFYVGPGLTKIGEDVATRTRVASEAQQLISKERPGINVVPDPSRTVENLEAFPTQGTIDNGRATIQTVQNVADELLEEQVLLNRRVPLRYEFGEGQRYPTQEAAYEAAAADWPLDGEANRNARDQWLRSYRVYINAEDAFDEEIGGYPATSLLGVYGATRPPDAESIRIAQDNRRRVIESESIRDATTDEFRDPEGVAERVRRETSELSRSLKYDRASSHLLYVNPGAVAPHPVANAERPESQAVYEAQVKLWVQDAVLSQLYRINSDALVDLPEERQNVVDAPVKHVVSLDIPDTFVDGVSSSGVSGGGGVPGGTGGFGGRPPPDQSGGGSQGLRGPPSSPAPPRNPRGGSAPPRNAPTPQVPDTSSDEPTELTPVPEDPTVELVRDFARSPTGRVRHTPFYDVVPIRLVVRVDARDAPRILGLLQRDTLLTVTNLNSLRPIDPLVPLQEGFVYGEFPAVELDLSLELPLLRRWNLTFMPESIRQALAGLESTL
jgi:hypothetical protein